LLLLLLVLFCLLVYLFTLLTDFINYVICYPGTLSATLESIAIIILSATVLLILAFLTGEALDAVIRRFRRLVSGYKTKKRCRGR